MSRSLAVFATVLSVLLLASSGFAVQLVWYMGDVAPDTANSAGPGLQFTRYWGANEGTLANDPGAIDGWAWHIVDTASAKDLWRIQPAENIAGATGGTVLARIKVLSEGSGGGNIGLIENGGLSSLGHWGGPTGHLKETERGNETWLTGDTGYHIIRVTAIGTSQSNRVINVYFDEQPTPVITITNAVNVSWDMDTFVFGANSTGGTQDIYFDWVTGSNVAAFAPGEEVPVLGQSLVPVIPEPSALVVLASGLVGLAGFVRRRRA